MERIEGLVSTSAFISYSLWSVGPLLNGASTSRMMITLPFVLTGIFRYQLISDLVNTNKSGYYNIHISTERPEKVILNDKVLRYIILLWFIIILVIGFYNN